MKTLTLTMVCLFTATCLFAQKIELSVQANPALFHFAGKSATKQSYIIESAANGGNYTNNPYGSNNGFSYGGNLQAQFVSKGGFLAGIQAGYDVLRSKVNINAIAPNNIAIEYLPSTNFTYLLENANGSVYLKNEFINLSPYVGYRISASKINIDLMPGIDIGFNLSSRENGKATSTNGDNKTLETDYKRADAPADVRFKFGIAALYKRYGLTASYGHGVTNYERNMIGGDNEAHSELMRLGLSYRIL